MTKTTTYLRVSNQEECEDGLVPSTTINRNSEMTLKKQQSPQRQQHHLQQQQQLHQKQQFQQREPQTQTPSTYSGDVKSDEFEAVILSESSLPIRDDSTDVSRNSLEIEESLKFETNRPLPLSSRMRSMSSSSISSTNSDDSSRNQTKFSLRQTPLTPPSSYICALTRQLMKDPVSDGCGHSYERSAILTWLQDQDGSCPISKKPMDSSSLYTNEQLGARIQKWREEHDYFVIEEEFADDYVVENGKGGFCSRLCFCSSLAMTPRYKNATHQSLDIEMCQKQLPKNYSHQVQGGRNRTASKKADIELLPQEQEALDAIRERLRERTRKSRRSKQFQCCALSTIAMVFLFFILSKDIKLQT